MFVDENLVLIKVNFTNELLAFDSSKKVMESNKNSTIQKFIHHPITRMIAIPAFILLTIVVIKELITKPVFMAILPSEVMAKMVVSLLSTFIMIGAYYLALKYYDKRPFTEFQLKYALKELIVGFAIGFMIISGELIVLYFLGFYEITGINNWVPFLASSMIIMGGVMLEEIVFRGVILHTIEKWKGTTIALIASSIIFQLPHFMNPNEGFLPAVLGMLFGAATGLLYLHTRRIWLPFAFHLGWNLAQPFFGTTLSGIGGFDILFTANMEGPELLTGSAFGIEDSLLSMLCLVIMIIIYCRSVVKSGLWVRRVRQH